MWGTFPGLIPSCPGLSYTSYLGSEVLVSAQTLLAPPGESLHVLFKSLHVLFKSLHVLFKSLHVLFKSLHVLKILHVLKVLRRVRVV